MLTLKIQENIVVCVCVKHVLSRFVFNPFKQIGHAYPYQLDQSISVLRCVGAVFNFYSNFDIISCNQTVETLIIRFVLWRLIWFAVFAFVPQKGRYAYTG